MALYNDLKKRNIISMLKPMIKTGAIGIRASDGKFYANLQPATDTPWIHIKSSYEHNCFLWKQVIFEGIVQRVLDRSSWFVPAGCQDCFKVVVKPKTLEQLFALEVLETRLNLPSKCGIEIRQSVFGNYGGYFYNRGIVAGMDCYRTVKEAVDTDPVLTGTTVLLKRGCTEMEHGVGPSDDWQLTQAQVDLEMLINQFFVNDVSVVVQHQHMKDAVHQKWIEHAYAIGDETVFNYLDGSLYPDYVVYHNLDLERMTAEGSADA